MKILAVDLGETTGYCQLIDRAVDLHGTHELGTAFPDYHLCLDVDLVVIERPAYVGPPTMQERYSNGVNYYRHLFAGKNVKIVRPADWMSRFSHYPLPERGVLKTQHEKDAYRLAHYAAEKFA